MRLVRFYKLAFLIVIIFLAPCPEAKSAAAVQVIYLTENNSGKKLTLPNGREFVITLRNHVDGGYRFDMVQYDSSVLRLEKVNEKQVAANSRPGEAGKGTWRFIAIKKGSSIVKITASRPWKGGGYFTVFENKVVVK